MMHKMAYENHVNGSLPLAERNTDSGYSYIDDAQNYQQLQHQQQQPQEQRRRSSLRTNNIYKHVAVAHAICLTLVVILVVITFTVLKTEGYLHKDHDHPGLYII